VADPVPWRMFTAGAHVAETPTSRADVHRLPSTQYCPRVGRGPVPGRPVPPAVDILLGPERTTRVAPVGSGPGSWGWLLFRACCSSIKLPSPVACGGPWLGLPVLPGGGVWWGCGWLGLVV